MSKTILLWYAFFHWLNFELLCIYTGRKWKFKCKKYYHYLDNNSELSFITRHSHCNLENCFIYNDKAFSDIYIFFLSETLSFLLTPKSFLFMILMATFCPVRMWRPNLTLAKPPEKTHVFKKKKKSQG